MFSWASSFFTATLIAGWPEHPTRLLPAYNSGDGSHPNDRGYQAMADAVDLRLFH